MTKLTITDEMRARARERAREANVAGALKAKMEVRCMRCGRVLTHPESIQAGIGPECATQTAGEPQENNDERSDPQALAARRNRSDEHH